MRTTHARRRVTLLVGAVVILLSTSLTLAADDEDSNRPVKITFTKWVTTFPLMAGYWGGEPANNFVGEIFERRVSQLQADNCYLPSPNCGRLIQLEALYEIHNGDQSFTALIRGGTSGDTGAALLDGTVLFGWRVGAPVHVTFQTIPGTPGCEGAPWDERAFRERSTSDASRIGESAHLTRSGRDLRDLFTTAPAETVAEGAYL